MRGSPERTVTFVLSADEWMGEAAVRQGIWNLRDCYKSSQRMLVLLGGRMRTADIGSEKYPFLAQEQTIARQFIDQDRPILGIGFGAELLSVAGGGKVTENRKQPPPGPPPVSGRFIDTYDANQDGKVTKDEFTGDAELFEIVASGKVRIEVNQTYPLKDAAQAHRDLEARKTTGSTILLP